MPSTDPADRPDARPDVAADTDCSSDSQHGDEHQAPGRPDNARRSLENPPTHDGILAAQPSGHDHTDGRGHGHGHGHVHESGGLRGMLASVFRPHSHDAADSVDSALEASADGIRAVKISLVVLLTTSLLQVAVVVLTQSVALLADTIHNFSDALTAVPLWIAFALGRRSPTRRYTYGYGRSEDLAGIFIVAMIALSAVIAGYESIRRLLDPQPLDNLAVLIAAAILFVLKGAALDIYRRLMDAVDPDLVDTAESALRNVDGVTDVESLRLRWIGHRLHAETALAVDSRLSVVDAHAISTAAHHHLLHEVPKLATATVHVSPAGPQGE